jgi:hypothetical protein
VSLETVYRRKAPGLSSGADRVRRDFIGELMFAFEVEYGENGLFQTGSVPIGLIEPIRTEILQMKERFRRFSKKGFTLSAF